MKRYLLTCALLALGASCRADDWPRWRGPEGTGRVPAGVAVPKTLPASPKAVWSIKVGAGNGSPVVSAGKLFYLDNADNKETVHALNATTGQPLWAFPIDDLHQDVQSSPSPRTTPVVDGDRVYVQSLRGEFQCRKVSDGSVIWHFNFVKDYGAPVPAETGQNPGVNRHGNTGSAVIDGDRIFVNVGGKDGASVVCLNKLTGEVIWKSQNDVPGYSGPIIATVAGVRQLIDFTTEAVIGLDLKDGALLWRVPIKTVYGRHATTPVVVGDTVVVGSYQAGLIGVRVSKADSGLKAEKAWTASAFGINYSSPVTIDKMAFGIGPANTLFCVDAPTGEKVWAQQSFFAGMVSTEYAAFMVMNRNLLVLTDSGVLLLIGVDKQSAKIIAKATVCGKNWCSPAYANGRIYLRDDQELKCLQVL